MQKNLCIFVSGKWVTDISRSGISNFNQSISSIEQLDQKNMLTMKVNTEQSRSSIYRGLGDILKADRVSMFTGKRRESRGDT